jgi:hypothetical protein
MKDEDKDKEEETQPKGYRPGPLSELGSGLLEEARKALTGRRRKIEDAIKEAGG